MKRVLLSLLAVTTTVFLGCGAGVDLRTLDARTLRVSAARQGSPIIETARQGSPITEAARQGSPITEAARQGSPIHATYFPSTAPRAGRHRVPLVVVEPVLFRREILYAGPGPNGGLVAYLQGEGFSIWLVGSDSPVNGRTLGRGIYDALLAIARETGARRFDLLGLSLGAEGALRALDRISAPGANLEIRRAAFLGAGFDFAYPSSFGSRISAIRGGTASALCTLDGDVDCGREFRATRAAPGWLAALPPADDDELAPARERFAFVTRFARLPVLFINGKGDGVAPSESMFPLYSLWGSDASTASVVPKWLFLAGRENALGWDFDHYDLFAGDQAEALWSHLARWLED